MSDSEIIGPLEREMLRRDAAPYDGIMGSLPEWVPDNFHREFHTIRDRLLKKYTHEHLLHSIATGIAEARNIKGMLTGEPLDLTKGPFEFSEVRGVREVSFLARLKGAVELGPESGLALLTDTQHAGRVKKGKNYGQHQSGIASNNRGKVGDNGKTINEIIGVLAMATEHQELSAKELWNHFLAELDCLLLEPKEIPHESGDLKKMKCEYDFKGGRKSIGFGQFQTVVGRYKKRKKSD